MMSARAINVRPLTTGSRQLPAEAEAQKVRPAQRTEVAVRIVEADLPIAAAVPDPAADRQAVGGEAGRIVLRREAGSCARIEGVGRLGGVAPPGGQREAAVPQHRPRLLTSRSRRRYVVAWVRVL